MCDSKEKTPDHYEIQRLGTVTWLYYTAFSALSLAKNHFEKGRLPFAGPSDPRVLF
jgi:hypothetical protein